jgi:ribosome maturation factor RimP
MGETPEEKDLFAELTPVVEGLGFSIVELKARGVKGVMHVHLVIFKPDGVTVDDCSLIHRTVRPKIEVLLDMRDIQLEVASPGIDRTIKSDREYSVFINQTVKILLDNESEWKKGKLTAVEDDRIIIEHEKIKESFAISSIRKAKRIG